MRVFTSGVVSANTKDGMWTSWQLMVDPDVIIELRGIEEDNTDRYIITARNANGKYPYILYKYIICNVSITIVIVDEKET